MATKPELIDFLLEARDLLQGHENSAYCQAFSNEDQNFIDKINAMPEVVAHILQKDIEESKQRAKREGRWCEECEKAFSLPEGLKRHIRDKHLY